VTTIPPPPKKKVVRPGFYTGTFWGTTNLGHMDKSLGEAIKPEARLRRGVGEFEPPLASMAIRVGQNR